MHQVLTNTYMHDETNHPTSNGSYMTKLSKTTYTALPDKAYNTCISMLLLVCLGELRSDSEGGNVCGGPPWYIGITVVVPIASSASTI